MVAPIFLSFQSLLPEHNRVALDLYQPFRGLSFLNILGQFLRGVVFAFIFYPFYSLIFERRGGKLLLFTSMFGLGLFGSVEPQPGSIEGIVYTITSFTEHASILIAVAIQMLIFVLIMFKFETYLYGDNRCFEVVDLFLPNRHLIKAFIIRFTIVHLFTYWIVGGIFYQISGYQEVLESMEIFILWRPLDNLTTVFLVFFGQIFRGIFLAILLYPFSQNFIEKKRGWALLYLLMTGLTILGSPLFLAEFISFKGSTLEFFQSLAVGIPEIFSQMLVFSLLFFFWQKRKETKQLQTLKYNMSVFLT
ncbi:MAG: hypothetical protein CVT95_10235 [Bacteroidetes bacterium HGW-Bacteroidetes-12]|nr:MAG: hypothetical protein CVT95_10235 [Bacteroidetes bacterium HGW-Bacteroidetes-12]